MQIKIFLIKFTNKLFLNDYANKNILNKIY